MRNAHLFNLPRVRPGPILWLLLVLVLAILPETRGQVPAQERVVVLDLHNFADLEEFQLLDLTEEVRAAALVLPRNRFYILTRENILQLLPPGTTLGECKGQCEVETARLMQAQWVVSGEVGRGDGNRYQARIRLHQVSSGALWAAREASGAGLTALKEALGKEAGEMLLETLAVGCRQNSDCLPGELCQAGQCVRQAQTACRSDGDCPVKYGCDEGFCVYRGSGRKRQAGVAFSSTPAGATVMEGSQPICQTPCTVTLDVGLHTLSMILVEHVTRTEAINVNPGLEVDWKLTLDAGWLAITGTEPGMGIVVDGEPVGETGETPLKVKRPPGRYEVAVNDPCHQARPEQAVVEREKTTAVTIKGKPYLSEIYVKVVDEAGQVVVRAEIGADGKKLGPAPGPYTVPACTRRLKVEAPGYEPWSQEVTLKRGEASELEARLKGAGSPAASGPGIVWVELPGGTYTMGSDSGDSDEKPPRRVTLRSFRMSRTEVTNAQYQACVKAGACTQPHWDDGTCWVYDSEWKQGKAPDTVKGADQPVVCVDWDQAGVFAKWVGGRLPTEAEWEYAARSGGKEWTYPWGNEEATCERAVMDQGGNGCGKGNMAWPVCSKPGGNTRLDGRPADGQLCDMAGNVWEWVEDHWHNSYDRAPIDSSAWISNPERPSGALWKDVNPDAIRVIRGGAWGNAAGWLRAAYRLRDRSVWRSASVGFRVVVPAPRS